MSCFCVSLCLVSPDIEFSADTALVYKAGENIKLNCSITGRPVPQVIWYKNGKEIDKKMLIDITTNIGSSSLFIRDADRDHRGVYMVEAKNSSGTKTESVNIRVSGWFIDTVDCYILYCLSNCDGNYLSGWIHA